MPDDDALKDLLTRTQQLEAHLLKSPEYRFRADQGLKRQVTMLYLAIALLFLFQGTFALSEARNMPLSVMALITVTSVLAIINCLLLIRTKSYLRRLNDAWLNPEERHALTKLRNQHAEMQLRSQGSPKPR